MAEQIRIFDTTLRDGEQSPGFSLRVSEKLLLARQLDLLGVDIIEAGFPIASPADAEAVRRISTEVRRPVIACLARCHRKDLEKAAWAIQPAARGRIHTFIATSDLHLKAKLRMTREQCLDAAVESVRYARHHTFDVEFSAEDATRSDIDFLCRIVEAVIKVGATTINLPDTVGYSTPDEIRDFFRTIRGRVPHSDKVIFSAHCHDDLGLAVANSLAAIEGGARQVECTINGIGERAGNCALEELVMALRVRGEYYGAHTRIDSRRLVPTSRLLSRITGMAVQRNKAVVGQNAFAHESGIHQHGMLKHRGTYEIMRPEDVGWAQSQMVMGRHSGRAALSDRLQALGFNVGEAQLAGVFAGFKALAEKKRE